MLTETHDPSKRSWRGALDIGKSEVVCCVRVPGQGASGRRVQEVQTYSTMTRSLLRLSGRLAELGVTRVVMEATSDYWRPAFYLLEAAGFETWLVNANDVKHLPGRPKTDKTDAVWLAKVAERQMIRPSFVPPHEIRALRDLTRYRVDLVVSRTSEKQRVEKLLEDAQIKLTAVATDIFGPSGRDMLAALIAGERDPKVLAQFARRRLRAKLAALEEAFTGRFTEHHAFLLQRMLTRIDSIDEDIAALDTADTTYICARVGLSDVPVAAGWLVHQVRPTEHGSEMRSRFWLGHPVILAIPPSSTAKPRAATLLASRPGRAAVRPALPRLGAQLANPSTSKDLLFHCGQEMNHLAQFLPALFEEFKDLP